MKWRYEFLVRTMNSYETYEFNGGDGVMGTRVIAPVNSMVAMEEICPWAKKYDSSSTILCFQ